MSASPYGRGLVGLLKRGWNEIPAVMGTSVFALLGLALFGYGSYIERTRGVHPYKYKHDLMVMRPDDPRLKKTLNTYPD